MNEVPLSEMFAAISFSMSQLFVTNVRRNRYLHNYLTLLGVGNTFRMPCVVSPVADSLHPLAILYYDHALTFGDEYKRIWQHPTRSPSLFFFLNRYFALLTVSTDSCSLILLLILVDAAEYRSYCRQFL